MRGVDFSVKRKAALLINVSHFVSSRWSRLSLWSARYDFSRVFRSTTKLHKAFPFEIISYATIFSIVVTVTTMYNSLLHYIRRYKNIHHWYNIIITTIMNSFLSAYIFPCAHNEFFRIVSLNRNNSATKSASCRPTQGSHTSYPYKLTNLRRQRAACIRRRIGRFCARAKTESTRRLHLFAAFHRGEMAVGV